jgi:hypothetical protein
MLDDLPTPSTTLAARYVRVLLTCRSCQQQRDADLQALIDSGRGDVPLRSLRWKCARCGHRDIDHGGDIEGRGAAVVTDGR